MQPPSHATRPGPPATRGGLYEVALLNSADPTHAPPPGLPRLLYEQALLERASQVPVDREQEWLAMAARNARVLYEVDLLRSAPAQHMLSWVTRRPGDRRSTSAPIIIRAASTLRTD